MTARETTGRERGFALLVVLWSLVIITLLITQIMASGRSAVRLAGNIRDAAMAQACADGAINEALLHVISTGPDHWAPDGGTHQLGCEGAAMTVKIESLATKINPNRASIGLLAGLFQVLGESPDMAAQLAGNVVAWRSPQASAKDTQALLASYRSAGLAYGPPGKNFADLSDLRGVLGMSPALLTAALPYLSLYASGDPDPSISSAVVKRALAISGQTGSSDSAYSGNAPVVAITAQLQGGNGLSLQRQAIVSLPGQPQPFEFLSLSGGY
jgi:general secretion pathway protein K